MSRNLYILAGVMLLFAVICFAMGLTEGHMQSALPANGTLWKSTGLFLTVGGLVIGLFGVMTALFEQIDRRTEERRMRQRSGGPPSR